MTLRHRAAAALALVAAAALTPATASASQLIARNVHSVSLKVNRKGIALVTYVQRGATHHVLLWGAVNAKPPDAAHPGSQARFSVDYAGGYGSFGRGYWRRIAGHNVCHRYHGPRLHFLTAVCTMPNGSSWALQTWQRDLRNEGWPSTNPLREAHELHASHWSGALPLFWLKWDWIYAGAAGGPFDHLYGRLTYRGHPVYGFHRTPEGAPTDSFGRLVYIDTHDPPWRRSGYRQAGGWYRYNSFLTRRPYGDFCDGVYRHIAGTPARSAPARGDRYRAIVEGPGVTPILSWEGPPPGSYQPDADGRLPIDHLLPQLDHRAPYDPVLDALLNADQRLIDPVPASSSSCYYTH